MSLINELMLENLDMTLANFISIVSYLVGLILLVVFFTVSMFLFDLIHAFIKDKTIRYFINGKSKE